MSIKLNTVNKNKASDTARKKPLILIVDDVVENIDILYAILHEENYRFAVALNAAETYQALEKEVPNLILLDVMLPDENGYQVAGQIRQRWPDHDISIIFVTAMANIEDKLKGFEAGGVDYIIKPFEEAEVSVRVKTHIELQLMRRQQQEMIEKLSRALAEVKQLRGIIPICARCKKVRNDSGYWQQVEQYIGEHTEAEFSHGLCPQCMDELYPNFKGGDDK